jgi:hypothetical protein
MAEAGNRPAAFRRLPDIASLPLSAPAVPSPWGSLPCHVIYPPISPLPTTVSSATCAAWRWWGATAASTGAASRIWPRPASLPACLMQGWEGTSGWRSPRGPSWSSTTSRTPTSYAPTGGMTGARCASRTSCRCQGAWMARSLPPHSRRSTASCAASPASPRWRWSGHRGSTMGERSPTLSQCPGASPRPRGRCSSAWQGFLRTRHWGAICPAPGCAQLGRGGRLDRGALRPRSADHVRAVW